MYLFVYSIVKKKVNGRLRIITLSFLLRIICNSYIKKEESKVLVRKRTKSNVNNDIYSAK